MEKPRKTFMGMPYEDNSIMAFAMDVVKPNAQKLVNKHIKPRITALYMETTAKQRGWNRVKAIKRNEIKKQIDIRWI